MRGEGYGEWLLNGSRVWWSDEKVLKLESAGGNIGNTLNVTKLYISKWLTDCSINLLL
jgi:hypothetical protein